MKTLTLKRVSKSIQGVFGVLVDTNGYPIATTAERPDLANKSNVSCIPEGDYICKPHISPSKGKCFSITNVVDRTHILIHVGNTPFEDSLGCILVGMEFGELGGNHAVLDSKKALNMLLDIYTEEFKLTIEDVSK